MGFALFVALDKIASMSNLKFLKGYRYDAESSEEEYSSEADPEELLESLGLEEKGGPEYSLDSEL